MTDQRWPTQSAADKLPLIFTPSIFDVSRLGAAAGMMNSPHIRGRMRVCFSTLLMKSCCLLHCSSSEVASILFQAKCAVFTPLYHYFHLSPASLCVPFYLLFGLNISSLKTRQIVSLMMHLVGKKREPPHLGSRKEEVAAEMFSVALTSALLGPQSEFPPLRCSTSFSSNGPFIIYLYYCKKY